LAAVPDDHDIRATIVTTVSAVPAAVAVDPHTACLVVIYGAELGKRIPLATQPIECGRSMQTDIPLDDEAVSRKHARFAWTGSSFIVRDLGSTNGTYVDDVMVQERTLKDGDRVKIGRTIFKFIYGGNIEASYHEEIYKLMTCDGLTQIHNKRAFHEALEREVSRSRRYQRILSVVLFDIDHFKNINDTRGHLAGDAILRQLATLVAGKVRREDIFARVGGEEFGILAPEVGADGARAMAEKLRGLVERSAFTFEDESVPITASFGVACMTAAQKEMTAPDLYKAADERLYLAKNSGRNRVM
jgi:diguanylate cyclase (GGDEF)-like protein